MLNSKLINANRLANKIFIKNRRKFTNGRLFWNSGKNSNNLHEKDINQLAQRIQAQQDRSWTPSLRVSLGILSATLIAVSTYTSYQVLYRKKPVFLPLWITSTRRRLYSTEANGHELVELTLHRLQERVCIDPIVTDYLGLGATIHKDDPENRVKIVVRTKTPGITGFSIHPGGKWGLSWKGFTRIRTNNDSGPLAPEGMSSVGEDDQSLDPEKIYRPRMPKIREAIVEGSVNLHGSNLASNAYVKTATVEFSASHDLDLPAEAPAMNSAVLIYECDGQEKTQKLW